MRIRSIKPDFWTNEKLSALPAETHMLAAALLNYADDEGYFNANPKLIQGALFPVRELSGNIPGMLQELSTQGGIGYLEVRFSTDQRAYGWILNFLTHQVVSKPRDSIIKPLFDACSDNSGKPPGTVPEPSATPPSGNGMEGNGIGMEREQGKTRPTARGDGAETNDEVIRQRMSQVSALTKRSPATKWSRKEIGAFKSAGLEKCSADDFAEQIQPLLTYYAAPLGELRPHWGSDGAKDFRRRDLVTILENWGGEVDRATKFCEYARKKADEQKNARL
jgi:hypothetical protein